MHPLKISCSSEPSLWCCCWPRKRLPPHAALQAGDQWCRTREPKPNCCRCERTALELVQNASRTVTSLACATPVPEPHLFPQPGARLVVVAVVGRNSPRNVSLFVVLVEQRVRSGLVARELDGSWIRRRPYPAPSQTLALLVKEGTPLLVLHLRLDLARSPLRTPRLETQTTTTTFIETTDCLGRLPSPPEP